MGDFSSSFDKINKGNFFDTTLTEILIDNHTIQANKRKIFDQLPSEYFFGFRNHFKKITKGFSFHISFESVFAKYGLHNITRGYNHYCHI